MLVRPPKARDATVPHAHGPQFWTYDATMPFQQNDVVVQTMSMSLPTTIVAVGATALDIPLIEPFTIATGSQTIARNVLVEVRLAGGTRGYGEAAPFPAVTGETQTSTLAAIGELAGNLHGADVREWRRLAAEMKASHVAAGCARCALATAMLHAVLRQGR